MMMSPQVSWVIQKGILVKDILPFVKELMCHIGRTIGVRLTGVQ